MKRLVFGFVVLGALIPLVFGLRGGKFSHRPLMIFFDMDFQPRYRAQGKSLFFSDGRAQRQPPAGTIAFGGNDYFSDAGRISQDERLLQADTTFYQGKVGDEWVKTAPVELSMPRRKTGPGDHGHPRQQQRRRGRKRVHAPQACPAIAHPAIG